MIAKVLKEKNILLGLMRHFCNMRLYLICAVVLTLTASANTGFSGNPATVQERLDSGETPFEIYLSNNALLPELYGKKYAGGLIASLDTTNGSGFVAAPEDMTGRTFNPFNQCTLMWTNINNYEYQNTGATATAIGTGRANTSTIVSKEGAKGITSTNNCDYYAAYASRAANYGGHGDWYLPSRDEMIQVVKNAINEKEGCDGSNKPGATTGHWTSSETAINKAYYVSCVGDASTESKNIFLLIRLIRSFPDLIGDSGSSKVNLQPTGAITCFYPKGTSSGVYSESMRNITLADLQSVLSPAGKTCSSIKGEGRVSTPPRAGTDASLMLARFSGYSSNYPEMIKLCDFNPQAFDGGTGNSTCDVSISLPSAYTIKPEDQIAVCLGSIYGGPASSNVSWDLTCEE